MRVTDSPEERSETVFDRLAVIIHEIGRYAALFLAALLLLGNIALNVDPAAPDTSGFLGLLFFLLMVGCLLANFFFPLRRWALALEWGVATLFVFVAVMSISVGLIWLQENGGGMSDAEMSFAMSEMMRERFLDTTEQIFSDPETQERWVRLFFRLFLQAYLILVIFYVIRLFGIRALKRRRGLLK